MLPFRSENTPAMPHGRQLPVTIYPGASGISQRRGRNSPYLRNWLVGGSKPCLGRCSCPEWRVFAPSPTTSACIDGGALQCAFDRTPGFQSVQFGWLRARLWATLPPKRWTTQALHSSSTPCRHLENLPGCDWAFAPSSWLAPLPRQGKLSQLNRAYFAVNLNRSRCPIPKRAAAFANFQIDKNLHCVCLIRVCVHAGRSSCPPPAG